MKRFLFFLPQTFNKEDLPSIQNSLLFDNNVKVLVLVTLKLYCYLKFR